VVSSSSYPPPEFPLASPYPGIVHHLSGPNRYALTQILQVAHSDRSMVRQTHVTAGSHLSGLNCQRLYFHSAPGFPHPKTRAYVRLLGPCFKTGRLRPFRHASEGGQSDAPHTCVHPNIAAHTLLFEQESAHAGAHASTVQSLVVPLYQNTSVCVVRLSPLNGPRGYNICSRERPYYLPRDKPNRAPTDKPMLTCSRSHKCTRADAPSHDTVIGKRVTTLTQTAASANIRAR